jgi:hypothetical protein
MAAQHGIQFAGSIPNSTHASESTSGDEATVFALFCDVSGQDISPEREAHTKKGCLGIFVGDVKDGLTYIVCISGRVQLRTRDGHTTA